LNCQVVAIKNKEASKNTKNFKVILITKILKNLVNLLISIDTPFLMEYDYN
jgi:hypothetical protein